MKYKNVITTTDIGTMIINRNDTVIGMNLSHFGAWESGEIDLLKAIIQKHYAHQSHITIFDIGANIGPYSVALSKITTPAVTLYSLEAQRLVYYMLAGNLAINGCDNVFALHAAGSDQDKTEITIPTINFNQPANFGALELMEPMQGKDFDGTLNTEQESVQTRTIDSFNAENVALIKIDVEGMEDRVIDGAKSTIAKYKPIIFFEHHKTDYEKIKAFLKKHNYAIFELINNNTLAIQADSAITINGFEKIIL